LKRQEFYLRTLDGLSGAEFASTVASRCGLSRCPQKMLLWKRNGKGLQLQIAERERTAVIETIDELMGMESDRHPMFSEGYDHALDHIKQFVQGRGKK
jgi:hypothetical protein